MMETPSLVCLFTLTLMLPLAAQQPASSLRGTWTASIGAKPAFQGTWSADVQTNTPNGATGSWTLIDQGRRIVAEGTWSAVKNAGSWSGSWSARILPPGGRGGGQVRSGTWRADVQPGGPKTFADLLQSTIEKQFTGAWRSAGLQGRWWLNGSR